MDETRESRIEALYEAAAALPPEQRARFVEETCRDDAVLGSAVLALLEHAEDASDPLHSAVERAVGAFASALVGERPEDEDDPLIGRRVGRYRVLNCIGAGGMGQVYSARDVTLDRVVALKFLPQHLGSEPAAGRRLIAEAKAASALDHPNICTVHEIARADLPGDPRHGSLFIAMACYDGETLATKLARGPLPVEEAVEYALQIADALVAADEAGLVHRDLKPANLIVTQSGRLKILDFGVATSALAAVATEGSTRGTLAYMSPEQTRGAVVDARADLWAVGVVLYEMLSGLRPFAGRDEAQLLHQIRHETPAPIAALRPEVPEALVHIVERCLQKDSDARYPTAGALHADLQAVVARNAEAPSRKHASATRVRALLAFAALLAGTGFLARLLPSAEAVGGRDAAAPPLDTMAVAVFPFTAATQDSALEQLGRDLAITLASALDGIEELHTVSPLAVLARSTPDNSRAAREAELTLARQMGAGRLLQGRLTRAGNALRLDAGLYTAGERRPLARVAVTGDPEQIQALTDSAALALVRELWRGRPAHAPVHGAIGTNSVVALRAYLDGEHAFLRGDMPRSVDAFERAFAADTTFWFAYWRSLRARDWFAGSPGDSSRIRRMLEHRHTFPPQDRLLIESWAAETLAERLRLLREVTGRFDSYWPAWDAYAEQLVHNAPYLGTTEDDARAALERLVELNPEFAAGWDRLIWVAARQGDIAAMDRAHAELKRTMAGVEFRSVAHRIHEIGSEWLRSGLPPADSLESIVGWMQSESERLVVFFAHSLVGTGMPREQLRLNAAILARDRRPQVISELWKTTALSWVSRGAWDSALVAIDRAAMAWPEPRTALGAYGLAVTGAALGLSPAAEATRRRPRTADQPDWSPAQLAELAWLDGVLAYVREDVVGLERSRRALERSSAPHVTALRGSLAAFAVDAAGQRARAGRDLARVEWESATRFNPPPSSTLYPFLVPVNRLVATGWLRETGQDAEAARLLTWFEATSTPQLAALRITFGWLGLIDRGEIAESMGDTDRARTHYARFLDRHDLPAPALEPRIARASAGLERLRPPR